MLKIGDFSKLSYISIRMLRYYDEQDILKPSFIDQTTKYRFYQIEQLETANIIKRLRTLGFSSKIIKEMLKNNSEENIKYHFNIRIKELQQELNKLLQVSKEINHLAKSDIKQITYNTVKKIIPKRNVISLRKIVPNYMEEKFLWDELYNEVEKESIKIINDGYTMAIFHDLEYKEKNVDIEVQMSVDKKYISNNKKIRFYETENLEVASITFNGSYDKVLDVSRTALIWIQLNNYELLQPTFNIYHVSPAQDNNSENWITECCYIIKERKIKNGKTSN